MSRCDPTTNARHGPPADARHGPAQPGQPIVRRRAPCHADECLSECSIIKPFTNPGGEAIQLLTGVAHTLPHPLPRLT